MMWNFKMARNDVEFENGNQLSERILEIQVIVHVLLTTFNWFKDVFIFFRISLQKKSNRKAMNRKWSNQKANTALKTKAGNKLILQIDKIQ